MTLRSVTPRPAIDRLLTGHFHRENGYSAYRPGGTNDWLIIYTIRGSGRFGDGEREVKATRRGDVMLLRPGTLHDYVVHPNSDRWELLWAHFEPRPQWLAWLDWPAVSAALPGLMGLWTDKLDERRTIEQALRKMNRLAVGSHRLSLSLAMNALEEALLWCAKQVPRTRRHDPRIELAEEYLCQRLSEKVTLDELAGAVGLSVSRLSYLFKKFTGVTPQQYYETQRLERARQLLEMTSLPVKSIATAVGFDNPFYFTLRFKRHTGKSPRLYKRDYAGTD